ncbi:MAG: CoA pyrophosphatase [Dysosmobacter sp.]
MPGLLGATAAYAVLVPVAETAEGLSLLYEVRSPALHHHSGEVCFPRCVAGMEPGDAGAVCPAGNVEDAGHPRRGIRLLGRADFLHLLRSPDAPGAGTKVAPAALERLRLNPAEVRQTFLVSLDWLAAHPPEVYRYPLLPVGAEQFPYARVQAPPDYRWTPGQAEVPVYDEICPTPCRGSPPASPVMWSRRATRERNRKTSGGGSDCFSA